MKNNKLVLALITGIAIGLTVGAISTYFIMKIGQNRQTEEYENERLTITEKLTLEIKKLTLKNTTYDYVDAIENNITNLKSDDDKYIVKAGMYMLKEVGTLTQVDETTLNILTDGAKVTGVDFGNQLPDLDSMVYISEKGRVSEAVFYVDGFQITYDLVGTKVTKIE